MPQDHAEAIRWYRKAAEQGHADAQYNLGIMYYEGKGVPQTTRKPSAGIARPPSRGTPTRQYNLGIMYYEGKGVPQDHAEAIRWYRKAAEQGHASAQTNLGVMYYEGKGVPQTTRKPSAGIARPPSRGTPTRSTTSASCMPRAKACRRIMYSPMPG